MLNVTRHSSLLSVFSGLALFAGAAHAESRLLIARNDPNAPNHFTISFPPEFGGDTTADIVSTHFAIVVDDKESTASIRSWFQLVNPLNIAGRDTGDITVVLAGESAGAYDEKVDQSDVLKGFFRTAEMYAVHFTGDLSDFGIQSPFILPGSSTGVVTYDENPQTGRLAMHWSGVGDLGGIPFSYVCVVNALFDTAVDCPAIRNVRASCRKDRLRGSVLLKDSSHDGQTVAVAVEDAQFGADPIAVTVHGDRARIRLKDRSGTQTVSAMGREGRCRKSAQTTCE